MKKVEKVFVHRAFNKQASIEQIYRDTYPRIFAFIYAKTLKYEVAEDIAQQTFTNAIGSIDSYRWMGKSFDVWLFRIAHNLLVSYYRRQSKHLMVPLEEANDFSLLQNEDTQVVYFKTQEAFELNKAINSLNSSQKVVLKLRFVHGLSFVKTAFLLDKSTSWVKVVQHLAIKRLRFIMKEAA
jgi:RNA polymerase sigma-70 factor (ECF subfamily)